MRISFTTMLLVTAACNAGEKMCTLLGCESQVTIERSLSLAPADVDELVYEVCRNDTCARAHLEWRPEGAEFTCPTDERPDPTRALTQCRLTPADGQALLNAGPTSSAPLAFTFIGRAKGTADALEDGDFYTFTLSRGDTGAVLVNLEGAVTYEIVQPNGVGCDPTCKVAKLP